MSKEYPNTTRMRRMQRFPGTVPDPEATAPIYGTYKDAKMTDAHYDIECAEWGDNETPVTVKYEED